MYNKENQEKCPTEIIFALIGAAVYAFFEFLRPDDYPSRLLLLTFVWASIFTYLLFYVRPHFKKPSRKKSIWLFLSFLVFSVFGRILVFLCIAKLLNESANSLIYYLECHPVVFFKIGIEIEGAFLIAVLIMRLCILAILYIECDEKINKKLQIGNYLYPKSI